MKNLKIIKRSELTDKEKIRADVFILSENTNGEFINSLNFLEYHPKERFVDDSIIVVDTGSGTIKGLMMAAKKPNNAKKIISHPGTTFAGPIIDRKLKIEETLDILEMLFTYYEEKYNEIQIKTTPQCYTQQPYGLIDYFLLKRKYKYEMIALSNIINISDIQTEEDILKMFSSNKRNHVKKAIKSDIFIFEENAEIKIDVWKSINSNLRKKFNVKTTHTYEEIIDLQFRCKEFIQSYYVYTKNKEYGAFSLVFRYKNVFHTQYLDMNYAYSSEYPNLLLIYNLISTAQKMGYKYFSMGASTEENGNILNEGLYNYKAGYGNGDIILPLYIKK